MLFRKKLPDEAIVAVVDTAMDTLSMETELLSFPALCFEEELVPTEALFRGLLEGFLIGVMSAQNLVKITSGVDISFSTRARRIFDDAIEKCIFFGAFSTEYSTFFWTTCYGLSELELNRNLFNQRLKTAMFQDPTAYNIGKHDALYQVSIAKTGMLQPTRNFQNHIKSLKSKYG